LALLFGLCHLLLVAINQHLDLALKLLDQITRLVAEHSYLFLELADLCLMSSLLFSSLLGFSLFVSLDLSQLLL